MRRCYNYDLRRWKAHGDEGAQLRNEEKGCRVADARGGAEERVVEEAKVFLEERPSGRKEEDRSY